MKVALRLGVALVLAGCAAPPATRSAVDRVLALDTALARFEAADYAEAARLAEAVLESEPERRDARLLLARSRYREGSFEPAAEAFERVLDAHPGDDDARLGLAYADLQRGRPGAAHDNFASVLERRPEDRDALHGLVHVARRTDAEATWIESGRAAAVALVRLDPDDRDMRAVLLGIEARLGGASETRLRPPAPITGGPPVHDARAGHDYLEVRGDDGAWTPIFVKGFNLGAARPGEFPTGFPEDDETWSEWLGIIADLGANTVRTYTLLPPAFYRALDAHNDRSDGGHLWLLQGVWTELPPGNDFLDPGYVMEFEAEIARVIDAVHGDLVLAPRPGHAHGVYDVDGSRHVLGWLVGREWEPFAVVDFEALHPNLTSWSGAWFEAEGGPMECWVARMLDFTAGYEARRHGVVRPLSFANWPTLDALDHPTEATRVEEDRWRAHHGVPHHEALAEAPWEDDRVSLDPTRIHALDTMPAGLFASYHVYPNFPDFLNLEPSYADGRDADGPSRYAAYLAALKAVHGAMPVLIAEFGISTSRGVAHVQPQGWNHGGLDERDQGRLVARMLRSIHDARFAGGVVFAFQDEWFKGTWSTAPWEVPADRRRMWFSAESPEQSYGVMAYRPARAGIRLDGDPSDWAGVPVLASATGGRGWNDLRELRVTSDEGYLYVLLRTAGGPAPPDAARVAHRIAIDTIAADLGSTALPEPGPATATRGVEFVIDLAGPEASRVRVVDGYDPAPARDGGAFAPPPAGRYAFVPLRFETNRERFARDGTRYPAIVVERGKLRYGSLDPASPVFDTRADVAIGAADGTIELRIPWGLLNVADPSARRVLVRRDPSTAGFDAEPTDGLHLKAYAVDPRSPGRPPSDTLPRDDGFATYVWDGWNEPTATFEPKYGVDRIRAAMRALPDRIARQESVDAR